MIFDVTIYLNSILYKQTFDGLFTQHLLINSIRNKKSDEIYRQFFYFIYY
jgi:hypothetical protein